MLSEEIYGENSLFRNKQYAFSILATYGFPVNVLKFKMSKSDIYYAYLSFKQKLNRIEDRNKKRCDCAFNSKNVAHSYCNKIVHQFYTQIIQNTFAILSE